MKKSMALFLSWLLALAPLGGSMASAAGPSLYYTFKTTMANATTVYQAQITGNTDPMATTKLVVEGRQGGSTVTTEVYGQANEYGIFSFDYMDMDLLDYSDGNLRVTVEAFDVDGNVKADTFTLTKDIHPPAEPEITKPDDGDTRPIDFELKGTAPLDAATVNIYANKLYLGQAPVTAGEWTFFTQGDLRKGDVVLEVEALDLVGNVSDRVATKIVVQPIYPTYPSGYYPEYDIKPEDTVAPNPPRLTFPRPGSYVADTVVRVQGTADPDVEWVDVYLDGHLYETVESLYGYWDVTLFGLPTGKHEIGLRAEDFAGNFSATVHHNFTYVDAMAGVPDTEIIVGDDAPADWEEPYVFPVPDYTTGETQYEQVTPPTGGTVEDTVDTLENGQKVVITNPNGTVSEVKKDSQGQVVSETRVDAVTAGGSVVVAPVPSLPTGSESSGLQRVVVTGGALAGLAGAQAALLMETEDLWLELDAKAVSLPSGYSLELVKRLLIGDTKSTDFQYAANQRLKGASNYYDVAVYQRNDFTQKLEQVTRFNVPVKLQLQYSPAGLSATEVNNLAIFRFDSGTKAWQFVGGKINKEQQTVSAMIRKPGRYAVLTGSRGFADVKAGFWAKGDIESLAARQVINGVDGNHYKPSGSLTRAEFAKLLTVALNLPEVTSGGQQFSDVKDGAWYKSYISRVVRAGLLKGYNGKFRPNDLITRQEMAVVLVRAQGQEIQALALTQQEARARLKFHDSGKIEPWAIKQTAYAVEHGYLSGVSASQFAPTAKSDRAQGAAITLRIMKALNII